MTTRLVFRRSIALLGFVLVAAHPALSADTPSMAGVQKLIATTDDGAVSHDWKYIVLHHSAAENGSVASIDEAHRQRLDGDGNPWRGIGYHFVIGNGHGMGDGELAGTFRWREQCEGAHAGVSTFNEFGIGICLIGDFETTPPTAAQVATLQRLIHVLRQEYGIDDDRLLAHRDLKPTACPGGQFPLAQFRSQPPAILKASQSGD